MHLIIRSYIARNFLIFILTLKCFNWSGVILWNILFGEQFTITFVLSVANISSLAKKNRTKKSNCLWKVLFCILFQDLALSVRHQPPLPPPLPKKTIVCEIWSKQNLKRQSCRRWLSLSTPLNITATTDA